MTAPAEPRADLPEGWIPWSGGPCPVPLESRPGIMTTNGCSTKPGVNRAAFWTGPFDDWWQHESGDPDRCIIAYRPETRNV